MARRYGGWGATRRRFGGVEARCRIEVQPRGGEGSRDRCGRRKLNSVRPARGERHTDPGKSRSSRRQLVGAGRTKGHATESIDGTRDARRGFRGVGLTHDGLTETEQTGRAA